MLQETLEGQGKETKSTQDKEDRLHDPRFKSNTESFLKAS